MKYYFLVIFVVVFDQISKISIKQYWNSNEISSSINIIGDFLRFYLLDNPGIAFGLNPFNSSGLLTGITCCIIVFLLVHFILLVKTNSADTLAIAFVLGGAIGNAIDRILTLFPNTNYKGVIDFIDIGFGSFRWYVFNVADMSITIGLILIIYQGFFVKKIEKKDNI